MFMELKTMALKSIYSKETYNQEVIKLDNTSRFSYLVYGCINVNTSIQHTIKIATSSELDCDKFVNIVRPYIEQVPSLLYKIRRDSTKLEFIAQQRAASEARDTLELE